MLSISGGFSAMCGVAAVACCQAAGCCFLGEEVDNFNETVRWRDLSGPLLGLPEVHELSEPCGPISSLLQHQLQVYSLHIAYFMCLHYEIVTIIVSLYLFTGPFKTFNLLSWTKVTHPVFFYCFKSLL